MHTYPNDRSHIFRKSSGVAALLLCLSVCWVSAQQLPTITPGTALQSYLNNGDKSFTWTIKDSVVYDQGTIYQVLLTSQQWREHTWRHQLNVIVPNEVLYDGALLFISSGRMQKDNPQQPEWHDPATDGLIQSVAQVAVKNKAIAAVLRQVPNQPLYGGLVEDELISYTLHQFQQDGDFTWPLLFPMVKSAVRGMDAVQELAASRSKRSINRFVLSGLSKRGWTTWLTSSQDQRVEALAPMVIDILNMPVNLNYQIEVWKEYSPQIQDYVSLGLVQDIENDRGKTLATMIDPYSYRRLLDRPKMLFMGTNDQYWVIDAVKHYIDSVPGQSFIHYVPNEGHDLGDKQQAFKALSAFWGFTLQHQAYPVSDYRTRLKGQALELKIRASKSRLVGVKVWTAQSADQDFRDETWHSRDLSIRKKGRFSVVESLPATGYKAFYVDLLYQDANGDTYSQSTRVFVSDQQTFFIK